MFLIVLDCSKLGSSIHKSRYTKEFLANFAPGLIDWLDWPAKAQDLHIIKNVFAALQYGVYCYSRIERPTNPDQLWAIITMVWDLMQSTPILNNCVNSMVRRVKEVYDNDGDYCSD